jgi:hypothetical protein
VKKLQLVLTVLQVVLYRLVYYKVVAEAVQQDAARPGVVHKVRLNLVVFVTWVLLVPVIVKHHLSPLRLL